MYVYADQIIVIHYGKIMFVSRHFQW